MSGLGTGQFVVPLADATDRFLVGGKAAELARLMGAGFSVPDGFVVTTAAFREAESGGEVPQSVQDALTLALARFPGYLAYRSSAVAEDLASASFAGQYESVLNVRGVEAGLEALRSCWRSAQLAHLDRYRTEFAAHASTEMAVLVHGMVDADTAGVVFGADPVSGARRAVIEASGGIGEKLLAGEVTPERWTVDRDGTLSVERLESGMILSEHQAREIGVLCRRIEDLYGSPQDIEWAYANETLHVLQSRPITALPIEPTDRPPEGQTWLLSDGFFPEPVLPLSYSTWLPRHSESWAYVFAKFGVPVETIGHACYYGRVYDRMVPLGNPRKDRPLPPGPILKLGVRLAPAFRKRLAQARKAVEEDLMMRSVAEWESHGRERLRGENSSLLEVDLRSLDNEALASHLESVLDHVLAAGIAHFEVAAATFASAGQLGLLMEDLLGWKPERVTDLIQGYGVASVEDGNAIRRAAEAIRADPGGHDLLNEPELLAKDPGPAGQAIREFLAVVGHRTVGQDLSQPTWAEDPTPIVSLIRHHLDHREALSDPRAGSERAEQEAKEALDPEQWETFKGALDRARRLRPYGDETEPDVAAATGLVRLAALEAGRRLLERRAISQTDDVFYLDVDELDTAIRTGKVEVDIDRRRAEHRWALANPPPRVLGPQPAPPPPAHHFPESVRPIVGAFLWAVENAIGVPRIEERDGDGIRGLAASPGRATGTVRVIRTSAEFDKIQAGDIVVCPMTMAAWSPIFPVISGLITEQGGPLSHPGTLAREYGLPAVLGVVGATDLFSDGQEITIDGGTGAVEVA